MLALAPQVEPASFIIKLFRFFSLPAVFVKCCSIDVCEVLQAVRWLKPGKSDGYVGLSSDYFLHACNELCVHVSLLFSGLLIYGCIPEELSISTVIPIPKGKHANMTNSNNYHGIALSSMFNKLFDLILLSRYYNKLCKGAVTYSEEGGGATWSDRELLYNRKIRVPSQNAPKLIISGDKK